MHPIFIIISKTITLITTPRSTNTFQIVVLLIVKIIKGLTGSPYFGIAIFPNIILANFHITYIILGSYFFLPRFLLHRYFTTFA